MALNPNLDRDLTGRETNPIGLITPDAGHIETAKLRLWHDLSLLVVSRNARGDHGK
jgi:hypothetical protein